MRCAGASGKMPGMARKWGRGKSSPPPLRKASANPCMKVGEAAPRRCKLLILRRQSRAKTRNGWQQDCLVESMRVRGLAVSISSFAGRFAAGFTDSTLARVFVFPNRGRFYTFVPHRVWSRRDSNLPLFLKSQFATARSNCIQDGRTNDRGTNDRRRTRNLGRHAFNEPV